MGELPKMESFKRRVQSTVPKITSASSSKNFEQDPKLSIAGGRSQEKAHHAKSALQVNK